MRFLYALLVIVTSIVPAFALSCEQATLRLGELAKHVLVRVDRPTKLAVGSRNAVLTFDWGMDASKVPDDVPTYLIVWSSAPVRFAGTGFLTLTSEGVGPAGVGFGQQRSRAIVPLHNPTAEMHGSISVQVLRAGEIELHWGLVAVTACGERIGTQDTLSLSAYAGPPRIVIQNPYDLENPDQIILSNDGYYRLHVFAERFRVFDVQSGLLILEAQGRQPNFSPTGRFLAAYQGGRDGRTLDLFDLETGRAIGAVTGPTLIWQNGDSVAIGGAEVYERVLVLQTLVDEITPPTRKVNQYDVEELCTNGFATGCHPPANLMADNEGCNGCGAAWSDVSIAISYDTGVVARWSRSDGHGWQRTLYSLGFAISPPVPVKPYETFMSDRTREIDKRTINRLGRLAPPRPSVVLAQGQTSHAPAEDWQVWGSHGEAHIKQQNAGARDLRARLMLHRFETGAGTAAQRASLAGDRSGRPAAGAHVSVPYVLFEQLSDIGLKLARGTILRNAVTSVSTTEGTGGLFHTAQVSPSLEQLLSPFLAAANHSVLDPTADCHLLDLERQHKPPDWRNPEIISQKRKLVAKCTDGLWSFSRGSVQYLVGQTLSTYGTDHENVYSNTYLLIANPGKPLHLVYLNDHFLPTNMPIYERGQPGFFYPGNLHQINFVDQRYLVFASPGGKAARVFDLGTLMPLGKPVALVDADLLGSVQMSGDLAHLLQINADGRLEVGRLADGQSVLSGRTTDDELMLALPDGRFDGTPEGAHFVDLAFAGDRGLYSFQQFERSLRVPGILSKALESGAEPYTADVVPPPSVGLEVRRESAEGLVAEINSHSVAGLERLRIMLDGVPVLERPLAGHDQKLQVEIPNRTGGRSIAVLAVDVNGALSRAISRPLKMTVSPKTTLRVLTVGIDAYSGDGFPPLTSAVADARAIGVALGKGNLQLFGDHDIRPALVNEMATPDAIRANLEALVGAAQPGDTIVFAFAGHGVAERNGQLRLATQGATIDTLTATSVGWDEVAAILSRAPTRVVVLLDACHAGNANFDRLVKNESMVKELLSGVRAPILIFAASKGRELSRERDGSGVFTRALINALLGQSAADLNNDRLLNVSELYSAVKRDVVAATGGQQTPWLARGDLLGDFPLFERLAH